MPELVNSKKICIIGLGYIGLPTAALLASRGYQVVGVDINPSIVDCVQSGNAHITELDLDMLLEAALSSGKLKASRHVESADIFIIAVPTPLNQDKRPDLSSVEAAFDSIAPHIKQGDLIILESTCPVGTTEQIAQSLSRQRPDIVFPVAHQENADVYLAYCPERVLPGQILKELIENDRVVGGVTPMCTQEAIAFYQNFVKGECLATDSKTAEMCKLTENTFRDVNIAFANELSMICDQEGINVWNLIQLANRHPRVNILRPGPGVGGHCIAVDPWFLIRQAPEQSRMIRAARAVNESKPHWVLQKIDKEIKKYQVNNNVVPIIACMGITFKENVSDIRESPSLAVVETLAEKYPNQVLVVEPNLDELPRRLINKAVQKHSLEHACKEADILVILVNHKNLKKQILNLKKEQIVLDFNGIWSGL